MKITISFTKKIIKTLVTKGIILSTILGTARLLRTTKGKSC